MRVIKRNDEYQEVDLNKITNRLSKLVTDGNLDVDPVIVSQRVCGSLKNDMTTKELDQLAADISASLGTIDPDFTKLAGRIIASDMQKNIKLCFSDVISNLYQNNKVSEEVYDISVKHKEVIEDAIKYERDYDFGFFALKTLQRSYLNKINDEVCELPQDMFMRVSIGIHGDDIDNILHTYDLMSKKMMIHATPTLFNAGTNKPQMSSCFLIAMNDDSINGIFKTLGDCAQISKFAGGIGLHIHNIRSTGATIRNTPNACSGIVPMLKIFNNAARYVNQEGKRPGSIAVYLQVDHADIFSFLDLKKNSGDEEERARDLFYGIWVPDLFMKRVQENGKWTLFCPYKTSHLSDLYGKEYDKEYEKLENEGLGKRTVNAQALWKSICEAQIETGTPYILFKDACNSKSNQKNLGTIKSSNLCCEVVQYTDKDETAVCNLASICLPQFCSSGEIDYTQLEKVAYTCTINLNKVIDRNFYPVPEAKTSNVKHRPIGIGVQGLADLYALMRVPFESKEAKQINIDVFETMYYGSMRATIDLAKIHGSYESFKGSPLSQGKFQFDLWKTSPSSRYDWDKLREEVILNGARNSLLIAPMPTATTSQIMGNNECFEPYTSNIYVRRTLAGEFTVINEHLVRDMKRLNCWSEQIKDEIISNDGSIQNLKIPKELKDLYKTSWEMSQKAIIDQAADRGIYVCQSQSMNLFVPRPTVKLLSSMHFYTWQKGLKTGMYYLRTKPAANPIKFTICDSCSG